MAFRDDEEHLEEVNDKLENNDMSDAEREYYEDLRDRLEERIDDEDDD